MNAAARPPLWCRRVAGVVYIRPTTGLRGPERRLAETCFGRVMGIQVPPARLGLISLLAAGVVFQSAMLSLRDGIAWPAS